ncbi:MAG TPA: hypothetical protein VHM19_16435 [Polyangiales bacterium]|jgi:hypothetical protein|nr:hypothetical protein [Polyangiales bacterium]
MKAPSRVTTLLSATALLGISAYAGVSHAFPTHREWQTPAAGPSGSTGLRPGGNGYYYTGGIGDSGMTCSGCHINAKHKISVRIDSNPLWEKAEGGIAYKPGQVYDIVVNLVGEHLGDGKDNNGMTLTIENDLGQVAGVFQDSLGQYSNTDYCHNNTLPDTLMTEPAYDQTTLIVGDCRAVISLEHPTNAKARKAWAMRWQAPKAGTGPVTLFVGVVDGDQPGSSSLNDDVAEGKQVLQEGI